MNLLVCLKPGVDGSQAGAGNSALVPGDGGSAIGQMDGYALEMAACLQDQAPNCTITLLSLNGEAVLREGIAAAGEQAVLLHAPEFSGSGPIAKGYVLAAAIEMLEQQKGCTFDLIFCGQHAVDYGSGLTGPVLADILDRPVVSNVLRITDFKNGVWLEQETRTGVRRVTLTPPCVLLVSHGDHPLRYPTLLRKLEAGEKEFPVYAANQLNRLDLVCARKAAGQVEVVSTHSFSRKSDPIRILESTGEAAAQALLTALMEINALR